MNGKPSGVTTLLAKPVLVYYKDFRPKDFRPSLKSFKAWLMTSSSGSGGD